MTHNTFKKIMYHLKTIVHCLGPRSFYMQQSVSNQLEVNYSNNYSAKRFQNVYMYGRDK